jgi:hypothetical protein
LAGADVTNVSVTCSTDTYQVSGSVSGATGSVTVLNNAGDAQVIPLNGPFTFSAQNDGSGYLVTISDSPATQTCSVTNGTGTLAGADVTNVTVSCIDSFSTALPDAATVLEDANATTIDVLDNDTASDAGAGPIVSVTQPVNGSVLITNSGADLSYEPTGDYCNSGVITDDLTYTITGGSSATVAISVTCVNDPSVANDDAPAAFLEDSGANTIDVIANDTDVEGDLIEVASTTNGSNGLVAIINGGAFVSYTPNDDFCGADLFTYTIVGGGTATVAVAVTCVDDPTVVNDDAPAAILEDSGANTFDVVANDTDVEGDLIEVASTTDGSNGLVAITNGGAFVSYTPNNDYCGADSFTYTIAGGGTATVTVDVACVNDEPAFAFDSKVHVSLDDIANPLAEFVACQFDMGPDNEDSTQSVNDFLVSIDSDPNGILSTVDVLNDGSLSASYSGSQGVATVSLTLQDDGGTDKSGDESVTHQFEIHVQDYIFRGGFDRQTCQ